MNAKDIVKFARQIKALWGNDPYVIAENLGIRVLHRENTIKGFTAQTIRFPGYPTIISINNGFSELSKRVLCAHELGHALLHEGCVNHFAITSKNVTTNVEQEANLFAIALLTDDSIDAELVLPLHKMNSTMLKAIIEDNLNI